MRPMEFASLSWAQVDAMRRAERPTVLLLPLGTVEPHGPHAPLSTDLLISLGLCRRVIERLRDDPEMGALMLPPLGYGVTTYASAFPGTIHISEGTLRALLVEICGSLIRQGLRAIMIVNNHFEPEHVRTIHRSLDAIQAETGVTVGFLDLTRRERAAALTEEFQRAECHAGQYETSLVLADRPDLVDLAVMRALPYVPVNLAEVIGRGLKDFKAMGLREAYNGRPADATAAEGRETYGRLTEMLIGLMRELVRGTGGRDLPGSYARV
ncbi:MAG: creatininase family protein [Armatimonadota bacterium]|nr:creatininase family protein [Armatimonadota bacterium]MDR7454793.1 creatininase family protein [Armatimonadota bacterium]MDR7495413.1 creatininase family protein [Armatimonadota bacterium]MDR7510840.1 creatininase family protein [Armatimonadota bacterium]